MANGSPTKILKYIKISIKQAKDLQKKKNLSKQMMTK